MPQDTYKSLQKARRWAKIRKQVKLLDAVLTGGSDRDIVIAIMGPTGVGKSTFINTVCGSEVTAVGDGLASCTSTLKAVAINIPDGPLKERRLILVDTPGFDDTYTDDSEILHRIAHWLAASYDAHMKLAGVVYLYDITQPRMLGTTLKNLQLFQKLCGTDTMNCVVLGTTKWGQVHGRLEAKREGELRDIFWKDMIGQGSVMRRFQHTYDSSWKMLHYLLGKNFENNILHIQHELVDYQKLIPDTAAGKHLLDILKKSLELQKKRAQYSGDPSVEAEHAAIRSELRMAMQSIQVLQVPLLRRIQIFFRYRITGECQV